MAFEGGFLRFNVALNWRTLRNFRREEQKFSKVCLGKAHLTQAPAVAGATSTEQD